MWLSMSLIENPHASYLIYKSVKNMSSSRWRPRFAFHARDHIPIHIIETAQVRPGVIPSSVLILFNSLK